MTGDVSMAPVAIIGAGFSGTMAALHLLPRIGPRPILLCERGEHFARGVAYGTEDPAHLLNVRAGNMSAFPEKPDHFLHWLANTGAKPPEQVHQTVAGTFVSRHLYGTYLTSLLNAAVAQPEGAARLILVPDEVVDLVPEGAGYRLALAGGNSHMVAGAVLAAGNLLPAGTTGSPYVADPWSTPFAEGLTDGAPVVVVGTGLSMVDIALHLRRTGFTGPVVALSRRGLRSHAHAATTPWPTPPFTDGERASPARLLRRLRREAAEAARLGLSWHSVVDSLRPITSDLWRGWSRTRQDSFLRHARPWWDIHRHRTAPPVSAAVEAMLASGFLTVKAAHIVDIRVGDARAEVVLRPRGGTVTTTIAAQRVINATGAAAPDRCGNPLVARLIARGLARLDRHRLGLDQADDLAVVGAAGQPTPRLWALGPLGTGAFWECVAVPDIRRQVTGLVDELVAALASAAAPERDTACSR